MVCSDSETITVNVLVFIGVFYAFDLAFTSFWVGGGYCLNALDCGIVRGIEIRNRFAMLRNRFFDYPGAPGLRFASHPFAQNDGGGEFLLYAW